MTHTAASYVILLHEMTDAEVFAEMRRVRRFDPDVNYSALIRRELKRRQLWPTTGDPR